MLRRTLANLARNHPKIVSILTGLTHSAHTSFDQLKIGSKSLGLPQRRDPKHQKSQPDPYTILLLYLEVYRDLHVHTTYTTTILVIHRLHCTAGQLPAKGTLSQYIQNIAGQRLSALRTRQRAASRSMMIIMHVLRLYNSAAAEAGCINFFTRSIKRNKNFSKKIKEC